LTLFFSYRIHTHYSPSYELCTRESFHAPKRFKDIVVYSNNIVLQYVISDLTENTPSSSYFQIQISLLPSLGCCPSITLMNCFSKSFSRASLSLLQDAFQYQYPSLHSPISLTTLSLEFDRLYNLENLSPSGVPPTQESSQNLIFSPSLTFHSVFFPNQLPCCPSSHSLHTSIHHQNSFLTLIFMSNILQYHT